MKLPVKNDFFPFLLHLEQDYMRPFPVVKTLKTRNKLFAEPKVATYQEEKEKIWQN